MSAIKPWMKLTDTESHLLALRYHEHVKTKPPNDSYVAALSDVSSFRIAKENAEKMEWRTLPESEWPDD